VDAVLLLSEEPFFLLLLVFFCSGLGSIFMLSHLALPLVCGKTGGAMQRGGKFLLFSAAA